jgi:hypothetical protein
MLINRYFVNKKPFFWVFLGGWKYEKPKLVENKAFQHLLNIQSFFTTELYRLQRNPLPVTTTYI